jgi:hypothetical protein
MFASEWSKIIPWDPDRHQHVCAHVPTRVDSVPTIPCPKQDKLLRVVMGRTQRTR